MKMVLPQINLTGALRHYEWHIHRHAVRAGGDRAVPVASAHAKRRRRAPAAAPVP
jgi:hypothetical protein